MTPISVEKHLDYWLISRVMTSMTCFIVIIANYGVLPQLALTFPTFKWFSVNFQWNTEINNWWPRTLNHCSKSECIFKYILLSFWKMTPKLFSIWKEMPFLDVRLIGHRLELRTMSTGMGKRGMRLCVIEFRQYVCSE